MSVLLLLLLLLLLPEKYPLSIVVNPQTINSQCPRGIEELLSLLLVRFNKSLIDFAIPFSVKIYKNVKFINKNNIFKLILDTEVSKSK